MNITEKINFKQPKYMLPAIIYLPLMFFGYFFIKIFNTKTADLPSQLETTEYYNDKLPEANLKGDGIGDKYTNMLNNFGKIKDESAVENIDRDNEDVKEEYKSQYSEAEKAAMRKEGGNTAEENETLENLRRTLEAARNEGLAKTNIPEETSAENATATVAPPDTKEEAAKTESQKNVNEHAVTELAEDSQAEEAVKTHKEPSEYFNTIAVNEPEQKLIKAIVDEDIKAVDGSRVRLRLLDDIDIGERTIKKGSYLYCQMSGFSSQRVKGSVKSILVGDELVKVNLSIYDTDGLEGLYVPKSSFRETTQDIASGAFSQSMSFDTSTSTSNNIANWGMQALQNAYQKASSAISKNIKKNKVKIKYGTQVYLINSKEKKQNKK